MISLNLEFQRALKKTTTIRRLLSHTAKEEAFMGWNWPHRIDKIAVCVQGYKQMADG